ncbi:MAG TPA: 3-deoxy-manno-octulosonate cytidylyltransferase [Planctomycetota bacterium]|nr:3-deoxy-manno-octulosonate cytidylyltransferase [Planctomycetota bacterium]
MASAAAIIPVRYASTRLPGKPLLAETGQPLIRHVWEAVRRARRLDPVIVATDDARIAETAAAFGARVELTSPEHPSGGDRVAEVARRLPGELILNVQGDEPEVDPDDLDRLVLRLASAGDDLVTLARRLGPQDAADLADPHVVKLVTDDFGHALYFSRCPIPHGARPQDALVHQGVYGWRREALLRFAAAPPSALERVERLEQLRALALGLRIGVVLTEHRSLGIDTPEDYARFVLRYGSRARAPGGAS